MNKLTFADAQQPLLQNQGSPRTTILTGLGILGVLIVGFGLWAALAPLQAAVHAQGDFVFDTKRKTVQHLEGGIVKEILVREGDSVKAGQPVIILEDDQIRPVVDLLEEQSIAETAAIARLEAEKNGSSSVSFPASIMARAKQPDVARIIQTETKLFSARMESYQSQLNVLKSQMAQIREEIRGYREQLVEKKKETAALAEQLAANKELLKDGYVTRTSVLELERFLAEKSAERTAVSASIARDNERLAEFEMRITGLKNARIQDAVTEMKQSTVKRLELEERVRPSRNALERGIIRAPVSGKVVDLQVTTVGGVISPKEPLMDIVPSSEHLVLEAKIQVNDIHDVRVGLPAEVTLTAYKSSTTPPVLARVTYVSADRLTIRTAQGEMPYYAVRLELDPQSLKQAGNLQIYPGMAAQVSISTKPRTAFDYFIVPLTERMGKAFHEK